MFKSVLTVTATMLLAGSVQSTMAEALMALSGHDIAKGDKTTYGTDEICKFCHAPHSAQVLTGAPLWNHETTKQTFASYTSDTFKGGTTTPGATSKLCLSCHDGSVAADSYFDAGVKRTGTKTVDSKFWVGHGGTMTGDHPIGFAYSATLASTDGALTTPTANAVGGLPLFSGNLECATCHQVHTKGTSGMFLRVENTKSALCIVCHTK